MKNDTMIRKFGFSLITIALIAYGLIAPLSATASEPIPEDVRNYFLTDAPHDVMRFEAESGATSMRARSAITEPEIKAIQMTYVIDVDDDLRVTFIPSDSWTGVAVRNGKTVGTSTIWRDDAGNLQPGWSSNTNLGESLLEASSTGAKYAEAQWANCRFLWKEGTLIPLDDFTRETIPTQMSEKEGLKILQKKWEESKAINDELISQGIIPTGGSINSTEGISPWLYGGLSIIVLLMVAGIILLLIRRSRSRSSR